MRLGRLPGGAPPTLNGSLRFRGGRRDGVVVALAEELGPLRRVAEEEGVVGLEGLGALGRGGGAIGRADRRVAVRVSEARRPLLREEDDARGARDGFDVQGRRFRAAEGAEDEVDDALEVLTASRALRGYATRRPRRQPRARPEDRVQGVQRVALVVVEVADFRGLEEVLGEARGY